MAEVARERGLEPVVDGLERRFGPGDATHEMLGRALHVLASAARSGDVQASAALALFIMLDRNLKEIRDKVDMMAVQLDLMARGVWGDRIPRRYR